MTFDPVLVSAKSNSTSNVDDEPDWWLDFITGRLHRELPLPMGDEVRRRLLYHVALDLGTTHGGEITSAFLADRNPNALDTLAKRLASHASPIPYAGSLQSGPTKFRVLSADPGAATKPPVTKSSDDTQTSAAKPPAAAAKPLAAKPATKPATLQPPAAAIPKIPKKLVASRTGTIRSANHSGEYRLSDGRGRTLFVCRPTEVRPWFTVIWLETEAWPKSRIRIYPKVSVESRRNWAVVWEPDADELWFVDDADVTRVHIGNPAEVLVTRQGHEKDPVLFFKIPDLVRNEFQRLGFNVDRYKSREVNLRDGVVDGQEMLTAEVFDQWTIAGTVTGADGKPLADVPIRMRTALSPPVDVVTTKTDSLGNYQVRFRLNLRTIAEYRGVFVEPALDGFTERDFENAGLFDALLRTGEQPNRVVVWKYPPMWLLGGIAGKNKTGPIRRFSKRELIVERSARADFVMLPASVITGQIVGQDGKPLASHYVSVTAPDAIRPRGYETITDARSDKKGRFTFTNIPAGAPLNFTAISPR